MEDREGFAVFGPVTLVMASALEQPSAYQEGAKPTYNAEFTVDPSSDVMKEIAAHCNRVIAATWPGKTLKDLGNCQPLKNGDKEAQRRASVDEQKGKAPRDRDFLKGKVVFKANTQYQPVLGVLNGNQTVMAKPGDIYAGCEVMVEVNCRQAHDQEGRPRIKFYLQTVLKTKDGKRIGGVDPMERLKGVAGKVVSYDPTEGMPDISGGDDIPF